MSRTRVGLALAARSSVRTPRHQYARSGGGPLACVTGNIDVVQALGLAGIRSAVMDRPASVTRYSRYATHTLHFADPWQHPEEYIARLTDFASAQAEEPVLFYAADWDLLAI